MLPGVSLLLLRTTVTIVGLFGFGVASSGEEKAETAHEEPVWYWASDCGSSKLHYELTLDGAVLYETTIPLCQRTLSEKHANKNAIRIEFQISPARELIWSGYKDEPDTSAANEPITNYLWVKGSATDWMWVGQDFASEEHGVMNRWNFDVLPHDKRSFELPNGIVIRFVPISD